LDIQSRLNALMGDKMRQKRLADALARPGMGAVKPASEFFAERAERNPRARITIQDLFPLGRFVERAGARVFVLRWRLAPGDDQPVRLPMVAGADSLHATSDDVAGIYGAAPAGEWNPCRVAFLDTETTGLAGGTGTVIFLAGLGWFERDGSFLLEQYYIEDFDAERLLLELLDERLGEMVALCTYNGRGFDVPLLRTRMVLNRMRPDRLDLPNLDLLFFSRRLWKGALANVRLSTVEREVLGLARREDVPSADIPGMWHHSARSGDASAMRPVVMHHAQDIASLGALLAFHLAACREPERPGLLCRASEFTGLARLFLKRRDPARASALLELALRVVRDQGEEDAILYHLAALHRRAGRADRAVEIWEGFTARGLAVSLPAWVALAKHHEHTARDPRRALRLVNQCLNQLEIETELRRLSGRPLPSLPANHLRELEKRRERLTAKVARLAPGGSA
jgi:uncharacterized protein YprB with RNaseH-like and TPR domain